MCNQENNVSSRLSPQWLCGNSCTWAHDVRLMMYGWCMSCHKAIVVITGRSHCFHDCIYITTISLLWDLSTLCVVDHLWAVMITYYVLHYYHLLCTYYVVIMYLLCSYYVVISYYYHLLCITIMITYDHLLCVTIWIRCYLLNSSNNR